MENESRIRNYLRTGRRELRALLPQRKTYSAEKGVQRAEAKRPRGVSARGWKRQKKFEKRWVVANTVWFGAEEAGKVKDRRIPVSAL